MASCCCFCPQQCCNCLPGSEVVHFVSSRERLSMMLKLGTSAFGPNSDWFLVCVLAGTHEMTQIFTKLSPFILRVFIINSGHNQLQKSRLLLRPQSSSSGSLVSITALVQHGGSDATSASQVEQEWCDRLQPWKARL